MLIDALIDQLKKDFPLFIVRLRDIIVIETDKKYMDFTMFGPEYNLYHGSLSGHDTQAIHLDIKDPEFLKNYYALIKEHFDV